MNTYKLNSFSPAFAKGIDYTGNGIMFGYYDPELLSQIKAHNADETPEDIVVTVSDSAIALYPVYATDEEPEDCFFMLSRKAGQDLIAWAEKAGLNLDGTFQRLCFNPSDTGGIVLDDMPGEERKALYAAYEASIA